MGLLDRFRRSAPGDPLPALLGRWRLVSADPALELDPGAEAEFSADGRLTYRIPGADRDATMLLTYRVDGSELVTDQPSAPGAERTGFHIEGDVLTLDHGGTLARFTRVTA